jgi:hypothetical protein
MQDCRFPDVHVQLSGEDGNVFNIIGIVRRALTDAGHGDEAKQFATLAMGSASYDDVLVLAMRTVDVW